jgi:hypothetical protein
VRNTNAKKVSTLQTYPQLSQQYGKRAGSSCEGPSDSTCIESNEDHRNPSKNLPFVTTAQEAPQPTKNQQHNNPRKSRQSHKRTPLDTILLPHSADRTETSNESRKRERVCRQQIAPCQLSIQRRT